MGKVRKTLFAWYAWAFLLIWIVVFSGTMFGSACRKENISFEQKITRCSMALKLGEPLHFHADDHEYAELYLERAIANAHLGNIEQAQQDFAETLALLGVNKNFVFPDDIQPSSTAARIFSKMQSRLEGKTEYNIWAGAVKRALNTRPR